MELTVEQLWVMLGKLYAENTMLKADNLKLQQALMEKPKGKTDG